MSKQRCQAETTSSEFVKWIRYLDDEVNAFHREDYYWAQIAAEIRRGNVKHPKNVKVGDFIMTFTTTTKKKAEKKEKAEGLSREARIARSKSFWSALAGKEV